MALVYCVMLTFANLISPKHTVYSCGNKHALLHSIYTYIRQNERKNSHFLLITIGQIHQSYYSSSFGENEYLNQTLCLNLILLMLMYK